MFLLKPMQLLLITGATHIEGFVEKTRDERIVYT